MNDIVESSQLVAYEVAGLHFDWNGSDVLLIRDDTFEVDKTRQQVWRGMASQISGVQVGDIISGEAGTFEVLVTDPYGLYRTEVLISVREDA